MTHPVFLINHAVDCRRSPRLVSRGHQAVLDAYRRRGVEVWRTDRDGAVTLRIAADGTVSIATGRASDAIQP
jgi:hypothetical protein